MLQGEGSVCGCRRLQDGCHRLASNLGMSRSPDLPSPPEMGPIRRRKWDEIAPVALVPNTEAIQRELVEHARPPAGDPVQEHHQLQADLKAGIDNQQQQLVEMRNEHAQNRPLKTEEVQFAVSSLQPCVNL